MLSLKNKKGYGILFRYIGSQYLISFAVAFVFFFFIFFINQLLLLARRVLLSNVDFNSMIKIVVLAIPQFLLYTFPFASLSGASMCISDLSSTNEILALRSLGISMKRIYSSIIFLSLILSGTTFLVADMLIPYSSIRYQKLYRTLLTKMPSMELTSNSSTTFGSLVISNGKVEGSRIENIVLFDTKDKESTQIVSAPYGILTLLDINNYIYSLELNNPVVISTNSNNSNDWSISESSKAVFYIDFSNQVPSLTAIPPSNLSSVDLNRKIIDRKSILKIETENWKTNLNSLNINLAKATDEVNANNYIDYLKVDEEYYDLLNSYERPIDYYLQYYRAEFYKKMALSIACFIFIFITFPLSYIKFKHGKLVGFSISMFVAVLYWYMIFYGQILIFSHTINPLFIMWTPNIIILVVSLILIKIWRN